MRVFPPQLLEATDEELVTENWEANLAICDIVNTTTHGPEQAVRAIRKRYVVLVLVCS